MKYFLVISFAIIFASCRDKNNENLTVTARLIRTFDTSYYESEGEKAFEINLNLKNNSRESLTYWIMSCSWCENFYINNSYIKYIFDCPKNIPKKRTINPKDSVVYKAIVWRIKDYYKYPFASLVKETKFGFVLIDTITAKNETEYDKTFFDKSKINKIFWSNPINLTDDK